MKRRLGALGVGRSVLGRELAERDGLSGIGRLGTLAVALAVGLGGCGLAIQSADLFLLTRTGQGTKLTLVVSDSGAIRCNGAKSREISGAFLIQARDLSDALVTDANKHLSLPVGPGVVFSYRIRLQQGTITFTDRDTRGHVELARAELFAAEAAQQVCGLSG